MQTLHRGHARRPLIIGSVVALAIGMTAVVPGQAAIAPSTFDGLNGNIATTGTGLTDWDDLTLSNNGVADGKVVYKNDVASGQGDDSFTKGTDENTEPPVPGAGSVPPNKSDLTRFYLGTEKAGSENKQFLYLAWARVLDPNGTTNMDFEFNQGSDGISTNNVTPKRMSKDVLIEYKLSKGGTVPTIYLYRWLAAGDDGTCEAGSKPCWSARVNLSQAGYAEGSVNTATFTDDLVKSSSVDRTAYTFGEAVVDLNGAGLFEPGQCTTFGSAYLKSRSSDSFTAALKDYIAPLEINLTNCGTVKVVKQTSPDETAKPKSDQASFGFTISPAVNTVQTFSLNDASTQPADSEIQTINNVPPGQYTISETTVPTGWVPGSTPSCTGGNPQYGQNNDSATITVAASSNITCTFYNVLKPRLTLVKTITNDNGGSAAATAWTLTANGTGSNDISGSTGSAAVTNAVVDADTFALSESGGPSGYTPGSWSCVKNGGQAVTGSSVTLVNGDTATCTINNDDSKQGPQPIETVQTWVLHDSAQVTGLRSGGGAASFTFELFTDQSCTAGNEVEIDGTDYKETRSATFNAAGTTASASTSTGALVSVSTSYYWKVGFSGNSYNDGNSSCAEATQILAKDDYPPDGRDDFNTP